MRHDIVIIGGGFAGLWSAISAAQCCQLFAIKNIDITLIDKYKFHGIRPRYYELRNDVAIPIKKILSATNVDFIQGTVTSICPEKKYITTNNSKMPTYFSNCILASGSHLYFPNIIGIDKYCFNVDTFFESQRLLIHLKKIISKKNQSECKNIIVLGGGLTGIETACELPNILKKISNTQTTESNIILVDRNKVASKLSASLQSLIYQALNELSIKVIDNAEVKSIKNDGITFSDGTQLKSDTVISTLGMRASKLTEFFKTQRDSLGRLLVNTHLQLDKYPDYFIAGDTACANVDSQHQSLMSCQHARQQGIVAGYNAVASLINKPLLAYHQPEYVTCIDLGDWGAVYTEGWEHTIKATREKGKQIKKKINCEKIYPPTQLNKTQLIWSAKPKCIKKPIQQ